MLETWKMRTWRTLMGSLTWTVKDMDEEDLDGEDWDGEDRDQEMDGDGENIGSNKGGSIVDESS